MQEELIQDLNRYYGLELSPRLGEDQLELALAEKFNAMIRDDFSGLVQILYQTDVSENRLRGLLQTNTGEDAGLIIARLVIQRQLQKIETRKEYRDRANNKDCDEERW
jgi:hypothetical protein